ncbi:YhgE/Pip family protein [Glaciibacter flavus]|uniref:YhgE/Pip family protein n=1 Tax=Orlajensenia flava TaxID=2565934 RepID=UPI003B006EB1
MKVPQMIAAEFRRLTASRMGLIALIALLAVPVIYGGLYLWANQDPYAKLAEVPVALVVEDTGTADGSRNVGDEVADGIVKDATFDWHRVSASAAEKGLTHGTYDFSVTFPAEFSQDLASSSTDAPQQAPVVLRTNDANSYLATTIGEQAIKTIKAQIVRQVGQQSAITFLDSLAEIRGKLGTAADGAAQLTDGAAQAVAGSGQLHDGASTLADGNQQLADGSSQLAAGAARAADGASQVAAGNAQLAAKADQVGTVVGSATAQLPRVRQDIQDRLSAAGVDQATIDQVLATLDPLASDVQDGNAKVQQVVGQIDQLSSGAAQVADGTRQLADGSSTLASGAATAAGGAVQLRDGLGTLNTGLGQLESGAGQLRDGLAEGRDAIPDTDAATRQKQAANIADPVDVKTGAVTAAGSYGAGLAPFFAALAGWIGIYALFLIVKPVSRRAITALHSPLRVTLAGWLTPTILGAVQMSALYGILSLALGFPIANPAGMIGIMLLASATFAAIVLALNVWLGSVGQFLGLVLMVLQLVTAGGTFPWQTLPGPLAALHHVLPMGFVVDALRQTMYGGSLSSALSDVGVLLIWLTGGLVLAVIGVTRMTHFRTLRDLQSSLIG